MKNRFLPTKWRLGGGGSYTTFIPMMPKMGRKWQLIALALIAWFVMSKDVSVQFNLSTDTRTLLDLTLEHQALQGLAKPVTQTDNMTITTPKPVNVSLLESTVESAENVSEPIVTDDDIGNAFTNTTYTGNLDREVKRRKQISYVKRYAKVAREEMRRFGIPASVTMAQALIESDCGESRLARDNNNHFGIKCFSKTCKKGHCSNYTDDSHKDFFRNYNNIWESYRAHSQLLQKSRYKSLYKLSKTDYKSWSRGLKKAGYATDKRYADKLIRLIEDLQLYRLDSIE